MKALSAFTLIELLITIAIVGILASVAIPTYQESQRNSFKTEAIESLQLVMQAQERFYGDNGTYTEDLSELGFGGATFTTDSGRYELGADGCGNDIPLTQCVQVGAVAQGNQAPSGDLLTNSRGQQWRLVPGSGDEKDRIDHW